MPCFFRLQGVRSTVRGFAFLPFWALNLTIDPDLFLAEVEGVLQQALLAARQGEDELRHRHVGDRVVGGPDAAAEAVDAANQVEIDLAVQSGDEIRQRVLGGAQVDRAFQWMRPVGA